MAAAISAQAAGEFSGGYLYIWDASDSNRISTLLAEHEAETKQFITFRGTDNSVIIDQNAEFTINFQVGGGNSSPQNVDVKFENGNTLSVNAIQLVDSRKKPSNITVSGDGNIIVRGNSIFKSSGESNAVTSVFNQTGTYTSAGLTVADNATVTINNYASNTDISATSNGRLTLTGSAVNAKSLSVDSTAAFSSETKISVTKFNLGGLVQSGAAQTFSSVNFDGDTATLNAVAGSSFGSNFAFEGSSGYIAEAISLNVTKSAKKAEIKLYNKSWTGGNVLTLDSGADVTVTAHKGQQFQGSFTLGADLKNFTFTGGKLLIGENGHLTVSAAKGTVSINDAITVKNSTVTLNSNALDGQSFEIARNDAKLIVNTDSKLGALLFTDHGSNPSMKISLNGKSLEFTKITFSLDNSYIEFLDFEEGKVRITSDLVKNEDGTLKNIFAGTGTGRQSLYQLENGYLSLSNVPEPATCAALLGGLAILLALVKRRR